MAWTYIVYNSALVTTAAPVSQPTGSVSRTMLQLKFATGAAIQPKIIEWGCSFDGSAAATPGKIELVETGTVFATMSTAFAAADVQPWGDWNADANSSGSSGVPLNLATTASGFATGSVTEGTVTTTRMLDCGLIAPTNQYVKQFPLGREPSVKTGNSLRVRVTFGATVNAIIYIIFEV
ncbi:MAG TPA: hypothetical protein VNU68_07570 [Verrucomicrobiae bacterium]|nr:hypothetical protein [Verrucomicrobiae bacterium]